jgi:hypothetical protein
MTEHIEWEDECKDWMLAELDEYPADYVDACGEVNTTQLAEDCANEFDLYLNDEAFDVPEGIYDWAVDAAEKWQQQRG